LETEDIGFPKRVLMHGWMKTSDPVKAVVSANTWLATAYRLL
jgi:hypothetical protein